MNFQRTFSVSVGALILLIGPIAPMAAADETKSPNLVILGRVWTANPEQPWAEAVAVSDDKIRFVGKRTEAMEIGSRDKQVIDAGDGIVVPGLIDSHIHLIDGGLRLSSVQLRGAKTREEFVNRIAEYARTQRP